MNLVGTTWYNFFCSFFWVLENPWQKFTNKKRPYFYNSFAALFSLRAINARSTVSWQWYFRGHSKVIRGHSEAFKVVKQAIFTVLLLSFSHFKWPSMTSSDLQWPQMTFNELWGDSTKNSSDWAFNRLCL